ncbi:MAG: ChrR family anti-sigma-E factor [Paracoccaceae bacterium]
MSIHVAPDELLAEYAAGAATPGVSLLVAAHLTQVPGSRERVEMLESMGGALFADEPPEDMPSDALALTMSMLDMDEEIADVSERAQPGSPLPSVVTDALGTDFDNIAWKFQLPGVSAVDLDGFGEENVTLLRAKPGSKVPQHTHEGSELTLVLQGCLSDGGIEYRKGDIAVNDEHDDHCPHITGDEICYCLVVQQGNLRFTGRFSRVLNYIGE